jgi:hypothetical protein
MTDQKLNDLAVQAWKGAMGNAGTAVWLICQVTDLNMEEALALIKKTAVQVGGKLTVQLPTDAEVTQAVAALVSIRAHAIPAMARNDPPACRASRRARRAQSTGGKMSEILHRFDTLDDISTQLAAHADAIRMLGKHTIHNIIEIGRHLTEARDDVGHGNWLFWLSREFGWSDHTARNFMQVYELALKSENISNLDISASALYRLARPSTPVEVREEVIERAKTGERITVAAVKEVVEQAAIDLPVSNDLSDTPRKKLALPKAPAGSKPAPTTKSKKLERAVSPGDETLHGFTARVCDLRRRTKNQPPSRFARTATSTDDLMKLGEFLVELAEFKIKKGAGG